MQNVDLKNNSYKQFFSKQTKAVKNFNLKNKKILCLLNPKRFLFQIAKIAKIAKTNHFLLWA